MTSMEASSSSTTRLPQERPSGDSDDGQKKTGSGPSSGLIPSMSPPSHDLQKSHLSAFTNTEPGTVLPNEDDRGDGRIHGNQEEPYDGTQEEVLDDDNYSRRSNCAFELVSFELGLIIGLTLLIVIQFHKPEITMKSITFDRYNVSMGSDSSGFETYMASVSSTVKFTYRNTATFFGVHVTSTTLKLDYLLLTLANGTTECFYQSKKSQRTVAVVVSGNQIPMYASGASFISYVGTLTPVPLNLSLAVSSRPYFLGSLLEVHFDWNIYCLVIFDPKKLKVPLSLHNCIYN